MRAARARALGSVTALASVALIGCASTRALDGRSRAIEGLASTARDRGAYRCAPEELALAVAHLELAAREREQGDIARAREHLSLADLNARAALRLTSDEECGANREPNPERDLRDAASWPACDAPASGSGRRCSKARPTTRIRSSQQHVRI